MEKKHSGQLLQGFGDSLGSCFGNNWEELAGFERFVGILKLPKRDAFPQNLSNTPNRNINTNLAKTNPNPAETRKTQMPRKQAEVSEGQVLLSFFSSIFLTGEYCAVCREVA